MDQTIDEAVARMQQQMSRGILSSMPNQGGLGWKSQKLGVPLFDGNNPDVWIEAAENSFRFYHLQEDAKMKMAEESLEGDALLWYECEHRIQTIRDWEELKVLIRRQFRSIQPSPPSPPSGKREMPMFDSNKSDSDHWILEAERYFSCYRLREEDKLEVAVMVLEGHASRWYDWEHRR